MIENRGAEERFGRGGGRAPRSRTGGLWIGMILSAVVLVFLLIFVVQNTAPALINFLGWTGSLPTGVALLFAAVAGVLLVAIPGSLRILQLRRAARREEGRERLMDPEPDEWSSGPDPFRSDPVHGSGPRTSDSSPSGRSDRDRWA
jgi:lipopolysaccharide assembly protein A